MDAKGNTKQYIMGLNVNLDRRMIEYLSTIENKQAYLKELVHQDMQRQGIPLDDKRQTVQEIRSLVHQASLSELTRETLESIRDYLGVIIDKEEAKKE